MLAIVPILPVLFPLMTLLGGSAISVATVLGLAGTSDRRRMILRFLWKQKYSILVIIAVPALSWYGLTRLVANWSRAPGVPIAMQTGVDWPMFRGGPHRTGVVAGENDVLTDKVLWAGGFSESFYASPTVVGNRIYGIGSNGDAGRIFCWHNQTGELQWVHQPDEMRATFSSPVVVGHLLLCGEGLHQTANSRVFCLDLKEPHRPQLHWSFPTQSHVVCTPVVVGDRVYVAAGDDGVYALSLHVERDQRPALLWHVPSDRLPDVETSLMADARSVYVGTGEGGQSLVILDAATGKRSAHILFEFPLHAPPALVGQRLYVGMGQGDFVPPSTNGGGGDRVYRHGDGSNCLDLSDASDCTRRYHGQRRRNCVRLCGWTRSLPLARRPAHSQLGQRSLDRGITGGHPPVHLWSEHPRTPVRPRPSDMDDDLGAFPGLGGVLHQFAHDRWWAHLCRDGKVRPAVPRSGVVSE